MKSPQCESLIQNFLSAVPFYAQVQQGTPGIGDLRQYLMKISMVFTGAIKTE